jgi:N-acetylglucosaminyldiphosphoundecaprenol N-acetyl-beta-D-mannosaminyltransferase
MSTDGPGRRPGTRRAGIAPAARAVPADRQRFKVGTAVVEQLSTDALLDEIRRLATTTDRPALVVSGNAHGLVLAQRDPTMSTVYRIADLVRTDGASLVLAARLQGIRGVTRCTWADLIWLLAASLEQAGLSLYLLGGRAEAVDATARRLRERHPRLRLVGHHDGHFDQSPGSADSLAIVADLHSSAPDVVVVGLGMPRQERWLLGHLDQLTPAAYLTAGAVFDYASGMLRRPPAWMCDHGLEWLGRIVIEPRRLFLRYLIDLPRFGLLALTSAVRARWASRGGAVAG